MSAVADLTHTVTNFSASCEWTGIRDNERERWLELRQTMITASDMPAIMGHDSWRGALDVYASKVLDRIGAPESPDITKPWFWGKVLEQPILRAVAEYYGWQYQQGGALLRSRSYPHLGATLDAEINRDDGHGWLINEGKTSVITKDWDEVAEALPMRVLIQVQHQLLVTGAPSAIVFALLQGSRPCMVPVTPNEAFHAAIVDDSLAFMDRLKTLTPPPASASSDRVLMRMFPTHDGSTVILPDVAIDWTREIMRLRKQETELKARFKELKNLLKQSIGEATFGQLPREVDGKRYWRLLTEERAAYSVEASSHLVLRDLKGATMPGSKASTGESAALLTPENDDLAEGEKVQRVHSRRR
jgi:putative phage-type endonuclease